KGSDLLLDLPAAAHHAEADDAADLPEDLVLVGAVGQGELDQPDSVVAEALGEDPARTEDGIDGLLEVVLADVEVAVDDVEPGAGDDADDLEGDLLIAVGALLARERDRVADLQAARHHELARDQNPLAADELRQRRFLG